MEPKDGTAAPGEGNPLRRALDFLGRRPRRAFLLLFALSFSVQGFHLTKVPRAYLRPHTNWELQAVAVSMAERGTFADPYVLPTGATAHLPPVPPAIFGISYRLFGLTLLEGYVAWLVNMAISAAFWGMLPWLAGSVGLGGGAGVLAGVVGALMPKWPGHGENLTALATGLLMVAFVRRWTRDGGTRGGALLLGVAAGAAFHVQPALLPVVLGWMAVELWWRRDGRKWLHAGFLTLGMVLACLPWAWRNYRAFDAVFFVRSNLGLELRMGNHEGVAAAFDVMDRRGETYRHPRTDDGEARKIQEVGEVAYMRAAGREAVEWVRENPAEFVRLTVSRAAYWWLGPLYDPPMALLVTLLSLLALLGAWLAFPSMAVPQRWAIAIPLLTFPLVYYVVAYMPRYREPVDWLFLLLAAAVVWGRRPPLDAPALRPGPLARLSNSTSSGDPPTRGFPMRHLSHAATRTHGPRRPFRPGGLLLHLVSVALLCLVAPTAAAAQSRRPVTVAVGAHALTTPWYPGPLGARFNPAFLLGTDRTLREGDHWRLFLAANVGFFRHHWWMTGVSLAPELGIGRRLPGGLEADVRLGLGYMHYFWRRKTLELEDGRYVEASSRGKPSLLVPLSMTVAYRGDARRPVTVSPFVSARWGVQGLFLEEVPLMTHFSLLGGVRIQRRQP